MKESTMDSFSLPFPPLSKASWLQMIEADFKRLHRDYEDHFFITPEVRVERLRTAEDAAPNGPIVGIKASPWKTIIESTPETFLKEPGAYGSDEIVFIRTEHHTPESVLHNLQIHPEIHNLIHYVRLGSPLQDIGLVYTDPSLLTRTSIESTSALQSHLSNAISSNVEHPSVVVDAATFADKPSGEVAELLLRLVAVLDASTESGIRIEDVVRYIAVRVSLSSSYVLELCRVRALRLAVNQVLRDFDCPADRRGDISIWAGIAKEPDANDQSYLVHYTQSYAAAILGGCDGIIIPDGPGRRLSTAISRLLQYEAGLEKVGDVAAGSYVLEHITESLLSASWDHFLNQIDASNTATGGIRQ